MNPNPLWIFVSIICVGCTGSGANPSFSPYDTRNETVSKQIRKSIVYIAYGNGKKGVCTGTYANYPWGAGVMTAGHCVQTETGIEKSASFTVCHAISGIIELGLEGEPIGVTSCQPAIVAKARWDRSFDYAFLRFSSKKPSGLEPASISLTNDFCKGSVLDAAGYGVERDASKAIGTTYRRSLNGGSMQVKALDAEELVPGDNFVHNVELTFAPGKDSNSSRGDSGTSWWFKGKMVGIHWGQSQNSAGTSLFRTLSYYASEFGVSPPTARGSASECSQPAASLPESEGVTDEDIDTSEASDPGEEETESEEE